MGRVLDNKPIANQWLYKYGFLYDSNCHAGRCRGFERYYKSEKGEGTILWVTISTSKRVVFLVTEFENDNGVIDEKKVKIPSDIDINNEAIFITWLDTIVG